MRKDTIAATTASAEPPISRTHARAPGSRAQRPRSIAPFSSPAKRPEGRPPGATKTLYARPEAAFIGRTKRPARTGTAPSLPRPAESAPPPADKLEDSPAQGSGIAPMHTLHIPTMADKREFYQALCEQLASLLAGERDLTANAANTAALLYHALPEVNWAGFYFLRRSELVLG